VNALDVKKGDRLILKGTGITNDLEPLTILVPGTEVTVIRKTRDAYFQLETLNGRRAFAFASDLRPRVDRAKD
jgi:hypothetical protein